MRQCGRQCGQRAPPRAAQAAAVRRDDARRARRGDPPPRCGAAGSERQQQQRRRRRQGTEGTAAATAAAVLLVHGAPLRAEHARARALQRQALPHRDARRPGAARDGHGAVGAGPAAGAAARRGGGGAIPGGAPLVCGGDSDGARRRGAGGGWERDGEWRGDGEEGEEQQQPPPQQLVRDHTYDVRFVADGVVERGLPRSMLRRPSSVAQEEENADPAAPVSCVVQKSDASVTVTEVSVRQPLTTLQE